MIKNDDSDYPVGYKKPPRHTRFQPGQSGNRKGRPRKVLTLPDVLRRELLVLVTVIEDGQRRRVSKLEAILKQHINKAAAGDAKATAMLLNVLRFLNLEEGEGLDRLLQQLRAIHSRHLMAAKRRTRVKDHEEAGTKDN
jgi:hypothetical protein